jgi:signal transduction histidine kinase/ActR/RegA family two-component response regulator
MKPTLARKPLKLPLNQDNPSYTKIKKSWSFNQALDDPETPGMTFSLSPVEPSSQATSPTSAKSSGKSQPDLVARKYYEKLAEISQNQSDPKYAFNRITLQFRSRALEKAYLLHQHDHLSLRCLYPAVVIFISAMVELLSSEINSANGLTPFNWTFGTLLIGISLTTSWLVRNENHTRTWTVLGEKLTRHSVYLIGTSTSQVFLVSWMLIGVFYSLTDSLNASLVDQCTSNLAFWKFALLLSMFLSIFLMRTPFLLNSIIVSLATILVTIYEIYYAQILGYGWCMSKKLLMTFYLLSGLVLIYFAEFASKKQFAKWIITIDSLDLAKSEAVHANQAKRNFLSYIFHEIRVPLSAISIAVDLIMQEEKDGKTEPGTPGETDAEDDSLVLMIRQQVDTVRHILDDVLSLQKIEEGKFAIEKAPFAISTMLREVHWAYEKICEQKNVKISLQIDPSLEGVQIVGDQYRLRQVLANFVSNALKFVPESEGSIKISTTEVTLATGKMIEISVRDNGVGISHDDQQKLFKPYIQISAGELQKGRGTGLGLNISKHIVRLHDGTIGVRSLEHVGSKFFFQIPLIKRENLSSVSIRSDSPQPPTSPTSSLPFMSNFEEELEGEHKDLTPAPIHPEIRIEVPEIVEDHFQRLRVLIVEDNTANAKLLKRMMITWGVTVTLASNGLDGVSKFGSSHPKNPPFDLVLMDKEMPVMQGDEAIRQIRALGFQLPIVVLTGNGFEEEMENMIEAGADAFLTKPTNAGELKATIHKLTLER